MNAASPEWMVYARTILSLLFVIGLMFLSVAVLKKSGLDKRLRGQMSDTARLSVIETLYIDARHRLILVRCDDKQHLLLTGPASTLVIDSSVREKIA